MSIGSIDENGLSKKEISEILGDEFAMYILDETRNMPKSVDDLVRNYPVTEKTIRRRVGILEEKGILVKVKSEPVALYKNNFGEVDLIIERIAELWLKNLG